MGMTRTLILGLALITTAGALTGCTDLRRALGIEKAPPDEFAVLSSTPLTVPPDYGLRPPHTPSGKAPDLSPTEQARVTVFRLGDTAKVAGGDSLSAGEQSLLNHAGGTSADPRIRKEVDAETQRTADASDGFVDDLLFWKAPPPPPGQPVNAPAEAQRIREDQASGQPVATPPNTLAPPSVERTERTPITGLP